MEKINNSGLTIGEELTKSFNSIISPYEKIVTKYIEEMIRGLNLTVSVGKSMYLLKESEYPELYSHDPIIKNIIEERLLCEDIYLYFNTIRYMYCITFIHDGRRRTMLKYINNSYEKDYKNNDK